jgi:hypothetical protein
MEFTIHYSNKSSKYTITPFAQPDSVQNITDALNNSFSNIGEDIGTFELINVNGREMIEYIFPDGEIESIEFDKNDGLNKYFLEILGFTDSDELTRVGDRMVATTNFRFTPTLNDIELQKQFLESLIEISRKHIYNIKKSDEYRKLEKLAELKKTVNSNTTLAEEILTDDRWDWRVLFVYLRWILLILTLTIIVLYVVKKKYQSNWPALTFSIAFIVLVFATG